MPDFFVSQLNLIKCFLISQLKKKECVFIIIKCLQIIQDTDVEVCHWMLLLYVNKFSPESSYK